jgi:hypothetical protein
MRNEKRFEAGKWKIKASRAELGTLISFMSRTGR